MMGIGRDGGDFAGCAQGHLTRRLVDALQLFYQGPHAPHGHKPLPGALPEDVGEEASVLKKAGILSIGRHPDLGISKECPTKSVILNQ